MISTNYLNDAWHIAEYWKPGTKTATVEKAEQKASVWAAEVPVVQF
jgi:hypothetical protein